jgi:hypothetical protein
MLLEDRYLLFSRLTALMAGLFSLKVKFYFAWWG